MTSFPFPRPSKPHSSPNMTFHTPAVLAPGRVRLPENSERAKPRKPKVPTTFFSGSFQPVERAPRANKRGSAYLA